MTGYDKFLLAQFIEEHWAQFVDHVCDQSCTIMDEGDAERIVAALKKEAES